MHDLEDYNGIYVASVHEVLKTENGESELDCKRDDKTEYGTQDFVTPLEVLMTAAEMRNSISHCKHTVSRELVEDRLTDSVQVR